MKGGGYFPVDILFLVIIHNLEIMNDSQRTDEVEQIHVKMKRALRIFLFIFETSLKFSNFFNHKVSSRNHLSLLNIFFYEIRKRMHNVLLILVHSNKHN